MRTLTALSLSALVLVAVAVFAAPAAQADDCGHAYYGGHWAGYGHGCCPTYTSCYTPCYTPRYTPCYNPCYTSCYTTCHNPCYTSCGWGYYGTGRAYSSCNTGCRKRFLGIF